MGETGFRHCETEIHHGLYLLNPTIAIHVYLSESLRLYLIITCTYSLRIIIFLSAFNGKTSKNCFADLFGCCGHYLST
jgi:hypothetical protein